MLSIEELETSGYAVDDSVTIGSVQFRLSCGSPTPISGDLLTRNAGKADVAGTDGDW